MSRRSRTTRSLKSCSRHDGELSVFFYWFSFLCVRHRNVFSCPYCSRLSLVIVFMTHHHPVCILISAVVHSAPLPSRSLSAPPALVTILINLLTLEVLRHRCKHDSYS